MMSRWFSLLLLALVFLVCGGAIPLAYWTAPSPYLQGYRIGWLSLLPGAICALGLWFVGLGCLLRWLGPVLVKGSRLESQLHQIAKVAGTAVLCLPLAGVLGVFLLLPTFLRQGTNTGILLGLFYVVCAWVVFSLILWRKHRSFWMIGGILVAVVLFCMAQLRQEVWPEGWTFWKTGGSVGVAFGVLCLSLGLFLRWWRQARASFRSAFQVASLVGVGLVGGGTWLMVVIPVDAIRIAWVGLGVFVLSGGILLGTAGNGLVLLRHTFFRTLPPQFPGRQGFLLLSMLPVCLLAAWVGVFVWGGGLFAYPLQENAQALIVLFGVELLAFTGLSYLQVATHEDLYQQHRVWLFFRPLLLFLLLLFPFSLLGFLWLKSALLFA